MDLLHRTVDIGEVRLHCAEMGQGPLVLLLHGFPECWVSWRNQLPALAQAGFRAVAPDLRGYGKSDKPPGLDAYRIEVLARDIARLVEALGADRAHVVGHDWGGAVAWFFAMWHPERLDRLAILNAPHPARFSRALKRPRQFLRSSYTLFFQVPWLPEALLRAGDFFMLRRLFRSDPERAGAYAEEGHWVHADAPERVNGLLIDFLRA